MFDFSFSSLAIKNARLQLPLCSIVFAVPICPACGHNGTINNHCGYNGTERWTKWTVAVVIKCPHTDTMERKNI